MAGLEHLDERELIQTVAADLLARDVEQRRPTVAELLRHCGLERWKLTHRHRDLNDAFVSAVGRKWGFNSPQQSALREQLALERDRNGRLNMELREARRDLRAYAEVIEELRIQNIELRDARLSNVHGIRRTSRLGD